MSARATFLLNYVAYPLGPGLTRLVAAWALALGGLAWLTRRTASGEGTYRGAWASRRGR